MAAKKKPREFFKGRAKPITAFRVPGPQLREAAGLLDKRFSPLRGPAIPIPGDQDEQDQERFDAWYAQTLGSLPEFIVWEYLTLKRKLRPQLDFLFQAPFLGGRTRYGGFVLDFYFVGRREGWMVQGERYHALNPNDRAKNALVKVMLAGRGIRVLEIWENDLLVRPDFVLDAAWFRGQEVGKRGNL